MASDVTLEDLFSSAEEQRAYEEFCEQQERVGEFRLDRPALVCRWRMAHRTVPLLNRHIRALAQRVVGGSPLAHNMLSWAKQHVEWSLAEGDYPDPDGVLMLVIDENGNAAMSVGAYEPLPDASADALIARAASAAAEGAKTGVAPEALCAVREGRLLVAADADEHASGSMTLVEQLAATCGHDVVRVGSAAVPEGALALVSDEHGMVLATDDGDAGREDDAAFARFLASGVAKLFS